MSTRSGRQPEVWDCRLSRRRGSGG
jgi:hypothetical protein